MAYSHTNYSSIAVEVVSSVTKDVFLAVEDFTLFPGLGNGDAFCQKGQVLQVRFIVNLKAPNPENARVSIGTCLLSH